MAFMIPCALLELGRVAAIVELLTHDDDVPYMDYVRLVSQDEGAEIVKRADLLDNMDVSRLKEITPKDKQRVYKHQKAYILLSDLAAGPDPIGINEEMEDPRR